MSCSRITWCTQAKGHVFVNAQVARPKMFSLVLVATRRTNEVGSKQRRGCLATQYSYAKGY